MSKIECKCQETYIFKPFIKNLSLNNNSLINLMNVAL